MMNSKPSIPMTRRSKWIVVLVILTAFVSAGIYVVIELTAKVPHTIDAMPVVSINNRQLPPGLAETDFFMDTGGDQMASGRAHQVGLGVEVRFRDRKVRQVFASCNNAGSGTALGGGGPVDLTVAACDGREFRLRTDRGEVVVLEITPSGPVPRATIALPQGITRAVLPK
jgi:hypothetical protein